MTFWMTVGAAYLALLFVGLWLGRYLSSRFPRGGRGRPVEPQPTRPDGPAFGRSLADWPPLGSAFDRQLLPGAFPATTELERL